MKYTAETLLVRPRRDISDSEPLLRITPKDAGWDLISFEVRRLSAGQTWSFDSSECELALVNLTGRYAIGSTRGTWSDFGGRRTVFEGGAHALYLPRRTQFSVTAEEEGEFAVTWVPTQQDRDPWFIRPEQVSRSIRGGDNVSRQINDLLPPGSPVDKLVLVEVYTPSGNWSSYPPHKHDRHVTDSEGRLIEADLEEIYYYKLDRPEGFAYQRIYTDGNSPIHAAGNPIDALIRAEDGCVVLVPEGYHPVVSGPGYTTYYLNVLAGSAQSLANQEDPHHRWVKETYRAPDSRLPLY